MYNYAKNYGFALEEKPYKTGSPASFIGRHICCLTMTEKNNRLIAKILSRIRGPKTVEAERLNQDFDIRISDDGKCHLFRHSDGQEIRVKNLGTPATPAFFYERFIFVFDDKRQAFVSAKLKVVAFNDNYVMMWIDDNLLIKFDVRGLACIGEVKSVYLVPRGVVFSAQNGQEKALYATGSVIQKLFVLSDRAKCSVDTETGIITHEYIKEGLPPTLNVDTYAYQGLCYVKD